MVDLEDAPMVKGLAPRRRPAAGASIRRIPRIGDQNEQGDPGCGKHQSSESQGEPRLAPEWERTEGHGVGCD